MKKRKTLQRKGMEVYIDMKKNFIMDLRKGSPTNLPVFYRCYWKGNEDISRIKKRLEHQKARLTTSSSVDIIWTSGGRVVRRVLYLLELWPRGTITYFLPKNKDKTLQIVLHCNII